MVPCWCGVVWLANSEMASASSQHDSWIDTISGNIPLSMMSEKPIRRRGKPKARPKPKSTLQLMFDETVKEVSWHCPSAETSSAYRALPHAIDTRCYCCAAAVLLLCCFDPNTD